MLSVVNKYQFVSIRTTECNNPNVQNFFNLDDISQIQSFTNVHVDKKIFFLTVLSIRRFSSSKYFSVATPKSGTSKCPTKATTTTLNQIKPLSPSAPLTFN